MTTLVGIQGDGYAVVGCDTQISSFDDSGSSYQISTLGTGSAKIAVNSKYLLVRIKLVAVAPHPSLVCT